MSDPEFGFSRWLRGQTSAGARCFVSIPPGAEEAGAVIGVTLIDEQDDTSEAPLERVLIQFDIFGPSKAIAHAAFAELKGILRGVVCPTVLSGGTIVKGVSIIPGTSFLPDESGVPRYIVTAQAVLSE